MREGFIVSGAPAGCREIHAVVRLAKGGMIVRLSRRVNASNTKQYHLDGKLR